MEGGDANTVNVDNPAQVARYVRGYRGIKVPEDMKGEFKDISFGFKNKGGKALDELAQEIADAQGLNAHDVQNRLVTSLRRFSRGEREATPSVPRGMRAEAEQPTPPEDIIRQWRQMDAEGRQATISALRAGGREPGAVPTPIPEPPAPPAPRGEPTTRFEPTPEGMQGVIPGAPGRAMPPTGLRPEAGQRPIGETPLFGTGGELRQLPLAEAPMALRWRPAKGPPGALEAFVSEDGRFQATQTTPDAWIVRDRRGGASSTVPTFHDARQWASEQAGGKPPVREPPVQAGSRTEITAERPPADVALETGEWSQMTAQQRQSAIDFFRGQVRTGLLPPLALGAAGAAALARPDERRPLSERFQHVLEALLPLAPLAAMLGGRGRFRRPVEPPVRRLGEVPPRLAEVSTRPPEVPKEFRREVVKPMSEAERVLPPEQTRAEANRVIEQAQAPAPSWPPTGTIPERSFFQLATDVPDAPLQPATRAARFFFGLKAPFRSLLPPEEVVRGDPGGTAAVRLSFRRFDDGLLLKNELETHARQVYDGLRPEQIRQVNRVLDTSGADEAFIRRALPDPLAEVALRAKREIFDAGADATGLPRGQRITGYFPHFRETKEIQVTERKIINIAGGEKYIPRTYLEKVPERYEAFFHKPRTSEAPANSLDLDAVLVFQRATGRHLTFNGGFHPLSREMIPGYLNEIEPLLHQVSEPLRPYVARLVNHFLGTPGSRPWPQELEQVSRIVRQGEFARLIGGNFLSPVINATQHTNVAAWVRPRAYAQGYLDLLNPTRRAEARRWLNLPELAKADLDQVGQGTRLLDRIESATGRVAQTSGLLFGASEKHINRYFSFLAGLREAEALGLRGRVATEFARDLVETTQFAYGGPATIELFRHPVGALWGQFKSFQVRQALHTKNLVMEDIKDWQALLRGQRERPLEVRGRTLRGDDGQVVMRPIALAGRPLIFPRLAKWLTVSALWGGPDVVFPGFSDWLEEQGVRFPGLLPAIGVGIGEQLGFGALNPADVTRSLLFFMPGPLIGHVQDALSAATGLNWGKGLTELRRGGVGQPLTLDERADRALKGFIPVAGLTAARGRRALKQWQTPGEERAARTGREAFGLDPATGRGIMRTEPSEPVRTLLGHPSPTVRKQREEWERRRARQDERRGRRRLNP